MPARSSARGWSGSTSSASRCEADRVSLRWVLFDLNGTLLDPSGIGEPVGLSRAEGHAVLDEAILHAMAETLSGGYRPFSDLVRAALRRRGGSTGLDEAMERAARMTAFPDSADAMDRLRAAGLRVGALTNSATAAAETALDAAGLLERAELVVGSDEVRAYKPDPRVYRHGAERAGAPPDEICLVAAHGWDLMGASRIGMTTGWVAREKDAPLETLPAFDVTGDTLAELAALLAERV